MIKIKSPLHILYEAPNRNLFSAEKIGVSLDSAPFGFISEAKQLLVSAECAAGLPILVNESVFYSLLSHAVKDNQRRFESLANYRDSDEPNEIETTTESPTTTTTTAGVRDKTVKVNSKTTLSSTLQTETEPAKEDTQNETQKATVDTVATTEKKTERVKHLQPSETAARIADGDRQINRLLYDCLLTSFYLSEAV